MGEDCMSCYEKINIGEDIVYESNLADYIKWRNFFDSQKKDWKRSFNEYFWKYDATDIDCADRLSYFSEESDKLEDVVAKAAEKYYGEYFCFFWTELEKICSDFEKFVRVSFEPVVKMNIASAEAHMNTAHLKESMRDEYVSSSTGTCIVMHNLVDLFLTSAIKGTQNYFMEKKIEAAGEKYYQDQMKIFAATPQECEYKIVMEIIKPSTYEAIDLMFEKAFNEFMQDLSDEKKIVLEKISSDDKFDPADNFKNISIKRCDELIKKNDVTLEEARSALISCPYYDELYSFIIDKEFEELYPLVKECALAFGFNIVSKDKWINLEDYVKAKKEYKERKLILKEKENELEKELEKKSWFNVFSKNSLSSKKNEIVEELAYMGDGPQKPEWSFCLS